VVGPARLGGWCNAEPLGHRDGQIMIDVVELCHLPFPDLDVITFAQLEPVGGDDVLAFLARHAVVEQGRLAVVVLEALAALADLVTLDFLLVVPEDVLIGDRP
jgi:hypothetical protein